MRTFGQTLKYLGLYFVSFVLLSFAISKFFNAQFQVWNYAEYTPLKDLSLFWHAWSFFGRSYTYNFFIGLAEVSAAILILFNRTRLIGLLIATGIYANIIIVDIEFQVSNAILHSIIEFVIVLILLIPYLKDLKQFFWDMSGHIINQDNYGNRFFNLVLPISFIVIASITVSILTNNHISSKDKLIGAYNISELIVKEDTLQLGPGKFTKEPMLFFEFGNTCILTLNDSTYYGNYLAKADSLTIELNKSFNNIKSIQGILTREEKLISGTTDNGDLMIIKIDRVNRKKGD